MKRIIEKLLFTSIMIVAIFFSTFHLKESPSVWYDEGIYYQTAVNMASGYGMNFQLAPNYIEHFPKFTVSYPLIYPLSLLFKIFGQSVSIARGFMAFLILILSASSYFLIRKRYGIKNALASLALLVTFPPLYGNGKSVLGEIPALIFLVLSLYVLSKIFENNFHSKSRLILSGLLIGLCASTKPLFLVFLPAVLIGLFIYWYKKRISFIEIVYIGIGVLLPILVWFLVQFIIGSDNYSISTILTFYANPYGSSSLISIVLDNIKNFFTEAGPIYLLIMMFFWLWAFIKRIRNKIEISIEEIIAFVFSVLVSLAYLRIVGWHRYIFPAQIISMIYFVPSLSIVFDIKFVPNFLKRFAIYFVTFLLISWGIYGTLFHSWVADFYSSKKTAFWEQYFEKMPDNKTYFFYNTPEVAIFSPTRNYYQYLYFSENSGPYGKEWLSKIENGEVDQVFVRTDNFNSDKNFFTKNYHSVLEAYKYTILEKNK